MRCGSAKYRLKAVFFETGNKITENKATKIAQLSVILALEKERGTHYGIRLLGQHIRSESRNYTRPCYIMKMDIRGYFMHIYRNRLLDICLRTLHRMAVHKVSK